jgi:hypothetical protein
MNTPHDVLEIQLTADQSFAERLRIARARASVALAMLRDLCDAPPAASLDRERYLRLLESELAGVAHWAGQIKRSKA